MFTFIISIIVNAAALLLIAHLVPGVSVSSLGTAVLAALVWGLVSALVKPVLQLLALPITMLTLGLFSFVINAFLFWLVAALVPGFAVTGFIPALVGSLILALVSLVLHSIL